MTNTDFLQADETAHELPEGWRWAKLGMICNFIYGSSLPSKERKAGEVPVYGSNGIVGHHSQSLTQGPAIIIGRKGSIGEVHLSEVSCWPIDTTYYVDQTATQADLKWLVYWLKALNLSTLNKAAAVPGLNREDAYALEIPLPLLDEQRRIAAILAEQMADVEQMRSAAVAELEAARSLPSALLKDLFSCLVFPKVRLGDVCDLLPSKSIATNGDTKVLVITTACLTETGFNPSGIKRAAMWASDVQDCLVSPGEVLIARSNTPELVGRAALVPDGIGSVAASDLTIRIQPAHNGLTPPFLAAYLSFIYVNGYWKDNSGGSSPSMKKITRTQVLDLLIPLPAPDEQQQIVEKLSSQLAEADQLRLTLGTKLEGINQLPAALLCKAFSGEL